MPFFDLFLDSAAVGFKILLGSTSACIFGQGRGEGTYLASDDVDI